MANNCLVTKLKATVDNDNLPYLDKCVLFYDSTIGEAEAGRNTYNTILFGNVSEIDNMDTSLFELNVSTELSNLGIKYGVTVPANYNRKMFFPKTTTNIITNYGTSPTTHLSKYKLRMLDIKSCVNLTEFAPIGATFLDTDNPNIESLSSLTKCWRYNITGKAIGNWRGDLVTFTDGLINNGINITEVPVIVLVCTTGGAGTPVLPLTVNGSSIYTGFGRNIHIVFTSAGHYSIYTNLAESTPLDDYSELTPIYTK